MTASTLTSTSTPIIAQIEIDCLLLSSYGIKSERINTYGAKPELVKLVGEPTGEVE